MQVMSAAGGYPVASVSGRISTLLGKRRTMRWMAEGGPRGSTSGAFLHTGIVLFLYLSTVEAVQLERQACPQQPCVLS